MPTDPSQHSAPPLRDAIIRPRPTNSGLSADPCPGHPRNAQGRTAYRFTDWAMI